MSKKLLSGDKYGLLTAICPFEKDKWGITLWKFSCECGKEHVARGTKVKNGLIKSCGCLLKSKNILRNNTTGTYLFNPNKKVNIPHNIWSKRYSDGCSFELFLELSKRPCHYCGVEFSNSYKEFKYNGLDRIDSNQDHSPHNIVPCCKICNGAKMAMSYDEFMQWINRVYFYTVKLNNFDNGPTLTKSL